MTATEIRKWVTLAAVAFALVMAVSFVAGQCREWREPKAPEIPKPIPGFVDPGTPAPGPVSAAPTVQTCLPVAIPDLNRAELEAEAAKLGFKLTPRVGSAASGGVQGSRSAPETPGTASGGGDRPSEGNLSGFAQTLLAKERFGPGPAGDRATVWAWQMEENGRVELWADFDPYQAPPVEPIADSGFFENVAKWHWTVGGGGVASPDGVGPGVLLGMGWSGPRTGHVTWGVDAYAIGGQIGGETTGAAFAGATLRIE